MVDLHIHTVHSDGAYTVGEILDMAEGAKLDVISFTDHDCVGAYREIFENSGLLGRFSGKIVCGVEIAAACCGVNIEILGYGVDWRVIEKEITSDFMPSVRLFRANRLIEILRAHGIEINIDKERLETDITRWRPIYQWLVENHADFLNNINPEFTKNMGVFFRGGLCNKKSELFVDVSEKLRSAETVIGIIKKAGGQAFLAHPAEYFDSVPEILEYLKDKLNGVEVFHPSAGAEFRAVLLGYAKKNGLLVSGGSDFHGNEKLNRGAKEKLGVDERGLSGVLLAEAEAGEDFVKG